MIGGIGNAKVKLCLTLSLMKPSIVGMTSDVTLAMSFGDRFCFSRKGGTGEVGGCTRGVQTAWPPLGSALK